MQLTLTRLSDGGTFTFNEENIVKGEKIGATYAEGTRLFYLRSEKTIKEEIEVEETLAEIMAESALSGNTELVVIPVVDANTGAVVEPLFNTKRILGTEPDATNATFLYDSTDLAPEDLSCDGDTAALAAFIAGGWTP
jgi:hypothetical protein